MPVSDDRMYLQQEDGTMMAMRADNGVIQVSSNGTDWSDLSAAGDAGLISPAVTVPVQDLTVTGLLGDTDGGYEIEGNIVTTAAAPDYVLYINGAPIAAGGGSSGGVMTNGAPNAVFTVALTTDLYIGSNATSAVSNIAFRIRMGSATGVLTPYTCESQSLRGIGTVWARYNLAGQFTPAAQITSISVHSSSAGTIDVGSYVRVRRLGFLA